MKEKLGIVLLGLPGSGKSTFANRFITPHNKNIKTFLFIVKRLMSTT